MSSWNASSPCFENVLTHHPQAIIFFLDARSSGGVQKFFFWGLRLVYLRNPLGPWFRLPLSDKHLTGINTPGQLETSGFDIWKALIQSSSQCVFYPVKRKSSSTRFAFHSVKQLYNDKQVHPNSLRLGFWLNSALLEEFHWINPKQSPSSPLSSRSVSEMDDIPLRSLCAMWRIY